VIGAGARSRILLVEDHADTARIMAELLENAGYDVLLAKSIASAVACASQPFDVLVSDIGLPDGSGLDLVRRLRPSRPVPAIALSGYGTTADVSRSHAAGFQRHLVKPVDLRDLLRAIDEVRLSAPVPRPGPRRREPDRGFAPGARRRVRRLSPAV